jgi:hypothetical protein
MQQKVSPAVIAVVIVIVLAVIGLVCWHQSQAGGANAKTIEDTIKATSAGKMPMPANAAGKAGAMPTPAAAPAAAPAAPTK